MLNPSYLLLASLHDLGNFGRVAEQAGQLTSFAGYTGWVGLGFSGLATGNANIAR